LLEVMAAALMALVIGMVAGPRYIRWLSKRGIGQNVRELGPDTHSVKQGTPTMGGCSSWSRPSSRTSSSPPTM